MHIPDQSDLPGEQSDRTAMAAAEALEPANLLALWDSISDVIVEIDESSRIRAINAACGPMFGYSRRELLGEPLHVLMPDALRDAHAQGFQRYVATGTKRIPWAGIQITARHKSGREFPIEVSFGERVVGGARVFSGVIRDVSARHAAETARLERDGVLLTVFHASPVAMAITRHADRSFVDVNAQFVRLTGWPADEVLGEAVTSLNLLDVARMSQLRGKRQERGALFDEVATLTTRGGERRTILLSTQPVEIGGQPMSLTTFTDITERRDAEERLERLNRTYAVLSDINQLMVREHEPESILTGACRIAVEKGGFALAWIGLAEGPQLRLGGYASTEGDGVELLAMLGAPSPRCQATARALATGTPVVCNDIAQDPMTVECRQVAMRRLWGARLTAVGGATARMAC
ncbi:MAG: PAS domain S-box protein [Gemmatimonadaceae bacterium]